MFSKIQMDSSGITVLLIICIILLAAYIMTFFMHVSVIELLVKIASLFTDGIATKIHRKEKKYQRDLEIGKINEKKKKYKWYSFFNDMSIDLGLRKQGVKAYELIFILNVITLFISMIIGLIAFKNVIMVFITYPVVFAAVVCTAYTKGNISHDNRIDAVIESTNMLCNSIEKGVVVAVKESLPSMPKEVIDEYKDFLDNMEYKNYSIKYALMDLNNNLGSVADDFISKCIMFETEEKGEMAGIFKDLVQINGVKTRARIKMKKKFERTKMSIIICACAIVGFLILVIAIFDVVRTFYFDTMIGQLVLVLDILIFVSVFVILTYLKAIEI